MAMPKRLAAQAGLHALVDGIPFRMPIACRDSPAFMAAFSIDADRARDLILASDVYPFRLWDRGLLVITVVDYRITPIGKYIEFSIAIACTRGDAAAPRLLPALFRDRYQTGQWVFDLPVSTEISVKGGKGIWGMPKHRASLDFLVTDKTVSSQYDLDGQMAMNIEIDRPSGSGIPVSVGAVNFCAFRGMLMKSLIHFDGRLSFALGRSAKARLRIGDHPRLAPLKTLDIAPDPTFTAFVPSSLGVLDDHCESWYLLSKRPPAPGFTEGMSSVVNLTLDEQWPPPPVRAPGDADG
jgi:hypothetical protein